MMTFRSPTLAAPRGRFDLIDVARGTALLAMATYHAVWDLGYLRLTPENYALGPVGKVAAHGIAGTFLFLVGIGLVLMNRGGLRPRPFALRLARISGAAILITIATYVVFPQSYIFFGILHCIAVSSVLAVPFLFLPTVLVLASAAAVIAAPHLVGGDLLDAPALFFLGLGRLVPQTNDYVPLFPWSGLVLLGVAAGRLSEPAFARSRAAAWQARGQVGRGFARAGRHSLAVYLVHQPVLLAVLTGLVTLTGPHPRAGLVDFRRAYIGNCTRTGGDPASCRIAARCVSDVLHRERLWAIVDRSFTTEERAKAQALSQACYDAAEGTAPSP